MINYLAVLRTPGVTRVIISQLMARFAFGMFSLAMVIHISQAEGSYAVAGLALASETIAVAAIGPLTGRWLITIGPRRMLIGAVLITVTATVLIALIQWDAWGYCTLTAIVGLSSPPIQSAVRNIYPRLVSKSKLAVLFGLDATLQEIIWVVGPVVATFIAAWVNSTATILTMAAIQLAGTLWFVSNHEIKLIGTQKASGRLGSVLKNSSVVICAIVGMLLIGSFGGVEVGTVALLPRTEAGIVVAMLSLGSIAGGLLFGGRAKTSWALTKYMLVICTGYALALVNPTDVVWLSICWFFAGIGIAPALGLISTMVSISLPAGDTAEAYGWVNTGQMIGYSIGSALAGLAIDSVSPASSLMVAVIFGVLTLAVAFLTVGITPALGKLHLETASIQTVKE
jgi:MFS family permease